MKNLTAFFDVTFEDVPRLISTGPPFVGAHLLMAVPGLAPAEPQPVAVNGSELVGTGYTQRQALIDLRRDCTILPAAMTAPDGAVVTNLRRGAVAAVDTALAACKADPPETDNQRIVHGAAVAAYRGKGGRR